MNNIIFIGMPAVGKSTIGVVAAKYLGYNFIDTDLLIQKKRKKASERDHCSGGTGRIFKNRRPH